MNDTTDVQFECINITVVESESEFGAKSKAKFIQERELNRSFGVILTRKV